MKVLIIGLGSIGKKHVDALLAYDLSIEVLALRSSDASESYKSVQSIRFINDIEVNKLDFVIISNPTYLHTSTITELFEYNVPLFIEKPLSNSLKGLNEIVKKTKNDQRTTYIACNLRFHPAIQFIKNKLEDLGKIQEVNIYCGSDLRTWREGIDYRKNYSANKELGGGAHLDLIHEIDYCFWLFGKPNVVTKKLSSKSSLGINAIDQATYLFEYKSFNANISLNYFRPKPKRTIEIITESEIVEIDLINSIVRNSNGEVLFHQNSFEMKNTYLLQMKFFMEEVLTKRKQMNTIEEAFQVLKLCIDE